MCIADVKNELVKISKIDAIQKPELL